MRDDESQPGLASSVREIGHVVCSMIDAAMQDPEILCEPVDAETASGIAPQTWHLYLDTSCDRWLPEATNGSFAAWCGAYLAAVSEDLAG